MALFQLWGSWDIKYMALHDLIRYGDEVEFLNNVNMVKNGETYTDVLNIYWADYHGVSYLAGPTIRYDGDAVTGGTVTAFFEDYNFAASGPYGPFMSLTGISVSASSFWNAIQTETPQDDFAVFQAALSGDDTFQLSMTNDAVRAYAGNDLMNGRGGNDRLWGDFGNDTLNGGLGNDLLIGGAGRDILRGGGGNDSFIFGDTRHSGPGSDVRDIIIGFAQGNDRINVAAIDAKSGIAGDQAFNVDRNGSFSAGEIRQTATNAGLLLQFNTDADATAEMSILLQGFSARLGSSDFLL